MQDIFLKSLMKSINLSLQFFLLQIGCPVSLCIGGGDFGSFAPCFSLNRAVRVS